MSAKKEHRRLAEIDVRKAVALALEKGADRDDLSEMLHEVHTAVQRKTVVYDPAKSYHDGP